MGSYLDRVSLRPALKSDYDFLYDLHCMVLKEYIMQTWSWDSDWQEAYFADHFHPEDREIILVDGEPAGVISIEERASEVFLANIGLLTDFQNRGIGSMLIRKVLQSAFSVGKPVTLHVLRVNPARRLYERLGFKVVKETPERFYMRADPPRGVSKGGSRDQDD